MSTIYTAHVFTKNRIVYLKSEDAQALDDVLAIVNMHDELSAALRANHVQRLLKHQCEKCGHTASLHLDPAFTTARVTP